MLARCQFGLTRDGRCGAIMTYPIKGYPWRRNPMKSFEFEISTELAANLFQEVRDMQDQHPEHCLPNDALWSDTSEKANGITRDQETDTLCQTIGIFEGDWQSSRYYYSMKEDSDFLRSSQLFQIIMALVKPHEALKTTRAQQGADDQLPARTDSEAS